MNENSFSSLIDSSRSILILLPTKPYFDQVAAGLSLYLTLRETKEVAIACPSPMLVEFNRLVGVNKVSSQLGNKNLTIRFRDYKASDIERVSYDIENGEFRLTVVPKPGLVSPGKEQVALEYSGIAAETVILIGGANKSHFPAVLEEGLKTGKLIHIGTRALDIEGDLSVLSFAAPSSSTSELVATLINQSGLRIDQDVATNLLMGIEEGSREFKGPDVSPETFEIVARLLRAGGQRLPREKFEKENYPTSAVPQEVKVEKKEEAPKDWLEPKIYKGTSIS
ncbi:MAG: DHH family phosphoesterase [Patescibacteria group bacterium]